MKQILALVWASFACVILIACSAQPEANAASAEPSATAAPGTHPISGLEIVDVVVENGDSRHVFRAELANTPQSQAKGLMFRTEMGDDEGMLFPSQVPAPRSFWMKNTPLSLDIIFVGTDGRISNIAADTVPYSLEPVVSVGPAIAVLELRAGRSAELGIAAGHRVSWPEADKTQ